MPKLTKQQMIILAALLIVVLYGAYEFLIAPSAKTKPAGTVSPSAEVKGFVSDATANIAGNVPAEKDVYIVSRAEAEWVRDPFFERGAYREWTRVKEGELKAKAAASGTVKAITFAYTGYLSAGSKKIAIINGIEYAAGDPLQEEGYFLKGISSTKVVIGKKIDRSTFDVLLQD